MKFKGFVPSVHGILPPRGAPMWSPIWAEVALKGPEVALNGAELALKGTQVALIGSEVALNGAQVAQKRVREAI